MNPDDPKTLVSGDWLESRLDDPSLRVLDGSWYLPASGRDMRAEYEEKHIPGAVFFDIDEMADPDSHLPHMVPSPEQFAAKVGKMGISNDHQIVVYDGAGLFSAARVWWHFRYMGHPEIAVLDGGLPLWIKEGRPLSDSVETPIRQQMTPQIQDHLICDLSDVSEASVNGQTQIVDARAAERFQGKVAEPRAGLRSGHIPQSLNVPHRTLLEPDGRFKNAQDITAQFRSCGVDTDKGVIASCGSGVTGSAICLALEIIGHRNHSLYDGSWSEWGGIDDLPVARA
ncbi:MAG: 3-mercaptopyruvate sulfurtransferase [Rhodobacteraceae bacterium]|nr:3-mercaptopyruvate sulfurtransferase [Paracoccaceae bacterium]MCY4196392.1 3-mercaptopyruvate sulfurtransferase [Paracoccaceae bacterium]